MITSIHIKGLSPAMSEFTVALTALVQELVREEVRCLKDELTYVKSLISEWVDTKEALRMTCIGTAETLKKVREQPGCVIVYKYEGRRLCYLRESLVLYGDHKIHRRSHVRLAA